MNKRVYVILESYTGPKGGNATSFGVFITKYSAIANLPSVICNRLGLTKFENFSQEEFNKHFINDKKTHWIWDRGEDIIEFYIQEDYLY